MDPRLSAFERLLNIMDDLREKCPWDRKQTFESLRNLTIEETYELGEAIIDGDRKGIEEEIGDLMLHMVFYAKIGAEEKAFDITSALNKICDKLVNRHPHVYGDLNVENAEEVKANWEKLKLKEGKKSVLSGVPSGLPSLVKAFRLQEKTATVGFEWDDVDDVWAKVKEEVLELEEALAQSESQERVEMEFGDVLFALVNYARFKNIDPESSLERTNLKFKKRFQYVEKHAPKSLTEMTLEQMDALWEEAKEMGI